jgi:uncharacterized protein YjbI with pentapeptide repeats
MANEVHVRQMQSGASLWNQWIDNHQRAHGSIAVDLSGMDLQNADFRGFRFPAKVDFSNSRFSASNTLVGAVFNDVVFDGAQFPLGVSFQGVQTKNASFSGAQFFKEVSFQGAVFNEALSLKNTTFKAAARFSQARFGGAVYLDGTTFTSDVHMNAAVFDRRLLLSGVKFEGNLNFDDATFSQGLDAANFDFDFRVSFAKAKFSQHTTFEKSTFSNKVIFQGAAFAGTASFKQATFALAPEAGQVESIFQSVRFERAAEFSSAHFIRPALFIATVFNQTADFSRCEFSATASFNGSHFVDDANFGATKFNELCSFERTAFDASANFSEALFRENIRCTETKFGGTTYFENVVSSADVDFIKSTFHDRIYFDRSTFDGSADFSAVKFDGRLSSFAQAKFSRVPDLRTARFAFPPDLHGTSIAYSRCLKPIVKRLLGTAEHPQDAARYRKLKQMSADAKDHEREIAFFAAELKAKRFHETIGFFPNALNILYGSLSDYGRSVARPFAWLAASTITAMAAVGMTSSTKLDALTELQALFAVSFSNSALLLGGDKWLLRAEALDVLGYHNGKTLGLSGELLAYGQSAFSLLLFVLVGLAIRNRFRIGSNT